MNKNVNDERNTGVYEAILKLETLDEVINFFDDLCTVTELSAIEQRYEVAKCLYQGMIYSDILNKTGASTATISRVNRSLNGRNSYGGYETAFKRCGVEKK